MNFSLQRIRVKGFRGVRGQVTLDFSSVLPGLYFVRGENRESPRYGSNSAGKSTFFSESLIWALTGEVSKSRRTGSAVENRGAASGTEVSVEFLLDGDRHVVSRTRSPNGLFVDGRQCEQRDVEKLLPMTEAVLRKTIVIDQFGEPFLRLRPEAKSQMFTDTLDLDKWLRAADSASEAADAAAKKLQSSKSAQEGCARALAEARDQYEQARDLEEKFEVELEAKIAAAKAALKNARRAANDCRLALDVARSHGTDTDGVLALNDEKSKLRRLQVSARSASADLLTATRELTSLNKRLSLYSGDASTCPECGQLVNEEHVRNKHAELKKDVATAKANLADAAGASEDASEAVSKSEKKIEKLEQGQKAALELLAVIAAAAEKSIAADRESNRLSQELDKLADQDNPHKRQCDGLETRIKKLRAEQKQLKVACDQLEADAEVAKFWVRGFREIRLEQIDAALLELEVASNRHAEALGLEDWRIAFATERETKKGTITHGFTASIYPPGEDDAISLDTYSGGGEANRWQHAVTFALSEVLLSRAGLVTDFEVVDEPTTHLSPEGIDDLLSCLSDRARELNRRIFLIDHSSLSYGSFDGVISVVKTKDRGSYIDDDGGVLPPSGRERVTLDAA
ncbi:MAG: AAA family ATPase [Elusimicrobia bacterium]|nr:AAA family ATPase [Elusimicrobiota bacterium]